jgi:hypothetical protein
MAYQPTLDEYVDRSRRELEENIRILESTTTPDNQQEQRMEIALARSGFAKILSSIGRQKEALEYYLPAWNVAKDSIPTKLIAGKGLPLHMELYSRVAYEIAIDYLLVLDFLANVAECENIFELLNKSIYSEGPHLGDYGYFLHRRKRDFEKAEQ